MRSRGAYRPRGNDGGGEDQRKRDERPERAEAVDAGALADVIGVGHETDRNSDRQDEDRGAVDLTLGVPGIQSLRPKLGPRGRLPLRPSARVRSEALRQRRAVGFRRGSPTDSTEARRTVGAALRGLAAELLDERRKVAELRREIAELRARLSSDRRTQRGDEVAADSSTGGPITPDAQRREC